MRIEVAYAKPDEQAILVVQAEAGMTAESAIRQSGMLARFPEIDLEHAEVGVFGKVCPRDRVLQPGDRVEIYRPLIADPKQARRNRAAKNG